MKYYCNPFYFNLFKLFSSFKWDHRVYAFNINVQLHL